jgi:hypothetical protein
MSIRRLQLRRLDLPDTAAFRANRYVSIESAIYDGVDRPNKNDFRSAWPLESSQNSVALRTVHLPIESQTAYAVPREQDFDEVEH